MYYEINSKTILILVKKIQIEIQIHTHHDAIVSTSLLLVASKFLSVESGLGKLASVQKIGC